MKSKFVAALVTAFLMVTLPVPASASFGCEVLLCLAASGGTPTECKPVLKKLFKRLAKGKSFPSCKMESGPDVGGDSNKNASVPKPERGIAVFVPEHKVCEGWDYRPRGHGGPEGRYCRKPKIIGPFYDHSGKTCYDWFPRTSNNITEDANYGIRAICKSKSKRWIRVQGGGVNGDYHYY